MSQWALMYFIMSNNVKEQVDRTGKELIDVPAPKRTIPDVKPNEKGKKLITENKTRY